MTIYSSQWRRNEFESGGRYTSGVSTFWLYKYVSRFGDGLYSLVSFLFAVLTVPPCPAISKTGTRPPCRGVGANDSSLFAQCVP